MFEPMKEPPIKDPIIYEALPRPIPVSTLPVSCKLDLNSIKGYSQKKKQLKLSKTIESVKAELTAALSILTLMKLT